MKSYLMIFFLFTLPAATLAKGNESKAQDQIQKATNVLNEIMAAPDKSIPRDLLNKAVCVGIIPSELHFAFGFGGSYGRGMMVCRRHGNGPWGGPSMFILGGGNFGFQLGGQATDVIFLVMNASGAKKLLSSSVKLGADASAAAGPVGRSAAAATDAQMHAEILTYSRSRGLFAGISLAGSVLKQDSKNNQSLYGRKLTPKQILIEQIVGVPRAAAPLDRALNKYSPHGGQAFSA